MTTALTNPKTAALSVLSDPIIQAAHAAALALQTVVITDESGAEMVTSDLAGVKKALKRYTELRKVAEEPAQEYIEALREQLGDVEQVLKSGAKAGGDAYLAWDMAQQRKAREERARLEREAQERARKAAEEAAITGEDAPPAIEVVVTAPPTMTRAGTASTHIMKRTAVSLYSHIDCDPTWLDLNAEARRAAEAAIARGDLVLPEDSDEQHPVRWRGLNVYFSRSAVSR